MFPDSVNDDADTSKVFFAFRERAKVKCASINIFLFPRFALFTTSLCNSLYFLAILIGSNRIQIGVGGILNLKTTTYHVAVRDVEPRLLEATISRVVDILTSGYW